VGDILHVAPPSGDSSAGPHVARAAGDTLLSPGRGATPRAYISPPRARPRTRHPVVRTVTREKEGGSDRRREGGEEATRFFQFLSVFTDCCSALWIDVVAIHVLLMAKNNLTLYGSGDVVLNLGTYFFYYIFVEAFEC
jgi:hypothetical protein